MAWPVWVTFGLVFEEETEKMKRQKCRTENVVFFTFK